MYWGPSFQEPPKPKPDIVGFKKAFTKVIRDYNSKAAVDGAADSKPTAGLAQCMEVASIATDSATPPSPPGQAPMNDSRANSDVTPATTATVAAPKMDTHEEATTDDAMKGTVERMKS